MNDLLKQTAERANQYIEGVAERRVFPSDDAINRLADLDVPMPDSPTDAETILRELDEYGSPATVATVGGRYFGFVTGGALPATVASNWLATAWDQNPAGFLGSPIGVKLEEIALKWLLDVLQLPSDAGGGFVTGATMANFTALLTARHALLERAGWDVEAQGLFGAPEIKVVVSDEVHVSVLKALGMVGFGRERVIRVPVDDQGRMRPDQLPELDAMTLVCIQAGNVNTGAIDPAQEICEIAHKAGAWVHVDGAFGLWALASPELQHLATGVPDADSWATDAHKWLNTPYDCGLVFCRYPEHMRAAMTVYAAYLPRTEHREPFHYTPELSRRARGVEIWAGLRALGKSGLSDMIERNCRYARRFAEGLTSAGYEVLNDVVLNQVLVKFGDADTTNAVIQAMQADGTMWAGGSQWQGHTALRISVSSWATTEADIERSLSTLLRIAESIRAGIPS